MAGVQTTAQFATSSCGFIAGIELVRYELIKRRTLMKLIPVAAVMAVLVLAPAAFAQQPAPTNKADCEKAKMKWDDKAGKDGKGACIAAKAETPKK
jgi:hypothetical protein